MCRSLPDIDEWDEKQLLAFEKESLGFYLSGHPLNRYKEVLDKYANADAVSIKEIDDGGSVRIGRDGAQHQNDHHQAR